MSKADNLSTQSIASFARKSSRGEGWRWFVGTFLAHPAAAFVFLSMLFGSAIIILTPPLEGPDEPAHFVHVYAMSRGTIISADVNVNGQKGTFFPPSLYDSYSVFEDVSDNIHAHEFDNQRLWAKYMRVLAKKRRTAQFSRVAHIPRRPAPVFVANLGAEAYSPAAYLPFILSILLAHVASFDFVGMLFSMRFAGLIGMTAVSAYAIAIAGPMRWPFFMIGMLPAAVYGRSVISAAGAALSYTMVITALCFRSARSSKQNRAWWDSLFMTLCVLSKPPQLAFIVLTAMNRPIRELRRYWIRRALIVLPASILSTLWIFATYRLIEGVRSLQVQDLSPEQFTVLWKIRFILEHPLHFPRALIAACIHWGYDYWLQLIGVLGWLDQPLQPWAYAVLSVMLIVACLVPLETERHTRFRIALVSGLATLGYCVAVFLIFFVETPIAAGEVQGVQGRYFLPALPSIALAISALLNRGVSQTMAAMVALGGAILSGGAAIGAILRVTGLPVGLFNAFR